MMDIIDHSIAVSRNGLGTEKSDTNCDCKADNDYAEYDEQQLLLTHAMPPRMHTTIVFPVTEQRGLRCMQSINIRAFSTKHIDTSKPSGISNNYETAVPRPGKYYRNRKF